MKADGRWDLAAGGSAEREDGVPKGMRPYTAAIDVLRNFWTGVVPDDTGYAGPP